MNTNTKYIPIYIYATASNLRTEMLYMLLIYFSNVNFNNASKLSNNGNNNFVIVIVLLFIKGENVDEYCRYTFVDIYIITNIISSSQIAHERANFSRNLLI